MFDFSAIDSPFLTRFTFGILAYWAVGFVTKGIFEKIQAYYGSRFLFLFNSRIQQLKQEAGSTCTKIDDLFVNSLAGVTEELNNIVNREDLSPSDQQMHRKLIADRYQLPLLLTKLGVKGEGS